MIRKPAFQDQFYHGEKRELSETVDFFLTSVPEQNINGDPIAILVPHAGYVFSGQTAGYAYNLLKNQNKNIENVILIANSHVSYLLKAAIYASGKFETPLGLVEINSELSHKIIQNSDLVENNIEPHESEHSIEVQIPFLQRTLKNFKIVPILLSNFSIEKCQQIGEAIAKSVKDLGLSDKTIIVCSSDMSHYPSFKNAATIDQQTLNAIEKFDAYLLKKNIADSMSLNIPNLDVVLCAEEAVYTTIFAAKSLEATDVKILKYSNSGDIIDDKSRVVGYGSAVFLKSKLNVSQQEFSVSKKNQTELLKIARKSIETYIKTGKIPKFQTEDPELLTPAAVFVTLTKNHNLRGCIGMTEARESMYKSVSQLAVAAAIEDCRFEPVSEAEISQIKIEISVLSPLKKIVDISEIKEGKHGVLVVKGASSGLFLPQVWESLPNKSDFMSVLCSQKACIKEDDWKKSGIDIYIFTVFAFEEK